MTEDELKKLDENVKFYFDHLKLRKDLDLSSLDNFFTIAEAYLHLREENMDLKRQIERLDKLCCLDEICIACNKCFHNCDCVLL